MTIPPFEANLEETQNFSGRPFLLQRLQETPVAKLTFNLYTDATVARWLFHIGFLRTGSPEPAIQDTNRHRGIAHVKLVADNIHGLNPIVADAMERLDPAPIRSLVAQCERVGADFIDVNPGYLSRRKLDRMAFLTETVEEATTAGLILDSPNPVILKAGLDACTRIPILNALSMEETKIREILPLAKEHGTRLVLLLMDDRSFTPPTVEEKLALAIELQDAAVKGGINPHDLIFDPVLPSLSWDDAYARVAADLKTIRLIATGAIFQEPADTMIGLSNLRSGMRRNVPFALEETCLNLLAGAGVRYLLADVLQPGFTEAFESVLRLVGSEKNAAGE